MSNKLSSLVSGQIARTNPLEGGPAYEAMMQGSGLIRDTWGGYLSRLLGHYQGKLEPEDAMDLLGIDGEMLHDPRVQFPGMFDFGDYEETLRMRHAKEAGDSFRPESIRLLTIFNAICEAYLRPADESRAIEQNRISDLIEQNEDDVDGRSISDEEWDAYSINDVHLRTHYDTLESGLSVPASQLAADMLGATPLQDDTMSELWRTWICGVKYILEDAQYEHPYAGDTPAKDFYLGTREIAYIRHRILEAGIEVNEVVRGKIDLIKPVFFAPRIQDHSLVTGVFE